MCLDYIFDFLIIHTRQKDRITLGSLTYLVTKLNLSWFALSHAQHFRLCVSRDTCLDWEVQDALYKRVSVLLSALAGGTSPFPLQTSLSVSGIGKKDSSELWDPAATCLLLLLQKPCCSCVIKGRFLCKMDKQVTLHSEAVSQQWHIRLDALLLCQERLLSKGEPAV